MKKTNDHLYFLSIFWQTESLLTCYGAFMKRVTNNLDPIFDQAGFAWVHTPLGPFCILAGPSGIRALWMQNAPKEVGTAQNPIPLSHAISEATQMHLSQAVEQVSAYFKGDLVDFDLALDPHGTPFQRKVWNALLTIARGEAISYKQLAERIGCLNASRAVGNANGRNPIALIIPCHRVISADGRLGGFSSGLDRKRYLLQHEGVNVSH